MPELPEVETTRRGIAPHIERKVLTEMRVRQTQLRWPVPDDMPAIVRGQKVLEVSRRGKYLLISFEQGTALWHLGMSGSLRIVEANAPVGKHDHVDWLFNQNLILRYNDPRRFGALLWTEDPIETHPLLSHLGPEPLTENFSGQYLFDKSRRKSLAVKAFVMDSKVVVGVGNIYANEALFASGIHPLKSCSKVSAKKYELLADNIKLILSNAIARGGTTLRDFVGGDGKPGYFAQELAVYGRGGEACKRCAKILTEKRLAQRTTVYCTACQR